MKMQKLTVFLFILVVGTFGLTFATRNQTQGSKAPEWEALKQQQEKKKNFNQDLLIVTAYALGPSGVTPLDDSPQFEEYRGISEVVFLQKLHDSAGAKLDRSTFKNYR